MKVGRNQPCPCGSGKKYKKCCLNKENVSSDLLYRRLGEAHDRLVHRLMQHGFKVFGENALGVALDEFMGWPEQGLSDENLADHEPLFYPWFLFNWEYEPDPDFPQLNGPEGMTIAELYAADQKSRLNHLEAQIIEATVRKPYSFYEIEEVRPGEGYRLKELFYGTVSNVTEKKGSENARRGQILFGRVVQFETVAMLIGCGTILIPPKMKPELIRFRQRMAEIDDQIDFETLYDHDLEIRDLYFAIYTAQIHAASDEPMRDAEAATIAGVRSRLGLDKPEAIRAAGAGASVKADRVAKIAHKIEAFGRKKLDPEYTTLALKLCDKIGRMRKLSIQRGRAEIWAAAIISVIARLNFLFDPDNEVYIAADELDNYFGSKKSTVSNKARMIQKSANLYLGDPEFSSAKIADIFRYYETEDGFIISGSMQDSWENKRDKNQTQPASRMKPAADTTPQSLKPRAKKPARDNKKKDADDRQLKLFDD